MIIGFSTGCLYKTHNSLSPETFDIFRKLGCNAIEIMFHSVESTDEFSKIRLSDLDDFDYISLHAPIYRGEHQKKEYEKALRAITIKHDEIGFDSIVLHPDMFADFDLLKQFDLPYIIENMDSRKNSCKDVADLGKVFSEMEGAPFLLDVNHVYTNDPTMNLTKELLSAFGNKLEEIHLSGFETFHDPLYRTRQDYFLDDIKDLNVPIIIESVLSSPEEAKPELDYINNCFNDKGSNR